jgi:hypothetical protein
VAMVMAMRYFRRGDLQGRWETQNLKTHHLVCNQRMFLRASHVVGQDIYELRPTGLVSGYKRGPGAEKNSTCT